MNHCHYENNCNSKSKFGNYCTKHRRYHLINDEDQMINIERFTGEEKDYLKKDIIRYSEKVLQLNCKGKSKTDLFQSINQMINNFIRKIFIK